MLSSDSLKERARNRLLESLANGRLSPGSRVSESRLAKELGSSRGPVREALNQLASQGFVEQIPGLGAYVKSPVPREMQELYEFREALESYAAGLAASRINIEQLAALHATLEETRSVLVGMYDSDVHDLDEATAAHWIRIDARFHGLILEAAGNTFLQRHGTDSQFLRRIWGQWLDASVFDVRGVLVKSYRDHTRIVRALRRGDAEQARRWMLVHVQATKQRFLTQMARQTQATRLPASAFLPSALHAQPVTRQPRKRARPPKHRPKRPTRKP
jgi:DNA-binding GntR family transcriptional regulator